MYFLIYFVNSITYIYFYKKKTPIYQKNLKVEKKTQNIGKLRYTYSDKVICINNFE